MIRLSYRNWYYLTHPWSLLAEIYRDVRHGVYQIWRWTPVIWYDRDWDWFFLAAIMERKIAWMAEEHGRDKWHVGAEGKVRELRTAAFLLKRIRNEYYYWDYDIPERRDEWCPPIGPWHKRGSGRMFDKKYQQDYDDYMTRQDLALLAKLMQTKLRGWWT